MNKKIRQLPSLVFVSMFLILALILTAISPALTGEASAPARSSSPLVEVNRVEGDGVAFTVSMKVEDLELTLVEEAGRQYTRVSLPGWAGTVAAGLPVLPVQVEQLGAPLGAEVSVEVSGGEAQRVKLDAPVLPGVAQVADWSAPVEDESGLMLPDLVDVYEEDAGVYGGGVYPGELALVSGDGMLRQQRVVGVSVYPVQYDVAAGELVVYETVEVTVRFSGGERSVAGGSVEESAVYEDLLGGQLLNYEAARDYRTAGVVESLPVENALEGMLGVDAAVDGAGDWVPPDPGWRVKVREAGMYKLSYEELQAAGVPVVGLDVSTLQLFNGGMEVALDVELGGDGVWGAGDYVVFYGEALESKYTLDNVYWLTYGKAPGLRMTTQNGAPSTNKVPANYPMQRYMSGGSAYLTNIINIGDREHFFWGQIYPTVLPKWTTTFTQSVPATSPVTIRITFYGGNDWPALNPDHHITAELNGVSIGDMKFDGISWYTATLEVPAGVFTSNLSTNTLVLTGPLDLGQSTDLVYVDSIELLYTNVFTAQNNSLAFSYDKAGTWKYQISGFTSNQVRIYDVTLPDVPVRITGVNVTGSTTFTAEFQDDVSLETKYWTGTGTGLKSVIGIEKDTASNLRSPGNAFDYIIITHPAFTSAANTLKNFRTSRGLRSVVVNVQDVYDEFGYGIIHPAAIHDFLAYAYGNWTRPGPSYVVLMGDGNYDPKNYLGYGRTSYIPPYLLDVDPWIQETAADNRLVTVSGADLMPDMMLGRLVVNTSAEADAIVQKIITYETNPPAGDWRNQFLAVTDDPDYAGTYNVISDNLVNCCVPSSYSTSKVYYGVTHTDVTAARTAIKSGYGKFIVNYIGHGYTSGWAGESLFTKTSVGELSNGGQQPIVLVMACLEGYYINPNASKDSLAEVTTRAVGKGAIASWSATGQGDAGGHDYLNRGFLTALLKNNAPTVGAATQAGKMELFSVGASPDLLDTYVLFGDPALGYAPIPTAVDLLYFNGEYRKKGVVLTWETANETDITGFNIYRSREKDGVKKLLTQQMIVVQNPGALEGAFYKYIDTTAKTDRKYFYWLESVDAKGETTLHGPVKVKTVRN